MSSLQIDGVELLVQRGPTTDAPILWGSYPMVPFAGRISRGMFSFDGADYDLPTNHPPHAMHGYGLFSEWDRVDDTTISLQLAEPWPFAGSVTQHFDLDDDRLAITMSTTATDRQPMMVGWHPWWVRSTRFGVLELDFQPELMYRRGEDGLPDGALVPPSSGPWDDCFTQLAADPVLRWGEFAVTLSSSTRHWVVFDELDHAVCVEPQSGPPNMINTMPDVLDAGETLTHTFTVSWF